MKNYQKPELFYERFELSQHIASCDLQVTFELGTGCTASGLLDGYLPVSNAFITADDACGVKFQEYCYTNATGITHTYAS